MNPNGFNFPERCIVYFVTEIRVSGNWKSMHWFKYYAKDGAITMSTFLWLRNHISAFSYVRGGDRAALINTFRPNHQEKDSKLQIFSCERWLLRSILSSKLLNNDSYIWEFFGMWFVFNFLLLWKISHWGKSTERIQNDLPLSILWTRLRSLLTQSQAHCIHGPAHSIPSSKCWTTQAIILKWIPDPASLHLQLFHCVCWKETIFKTVKHHIVIFTLKISAARSLILANIP